MFETIARWFGVGGTPQQKRLRAALRREEAGAEAFYPMRDEAIRVARSAGTDSIVEALRLAEADARKKRGTVGYKAALGVVAGLSQVLDERGRRHR